MDNLHFIPNNILTKIFKELTKYKNDHQQYLNQLTKYKNDHQQYLNYIYIYMNYTMHLIVYL